MREVPGGRALRALQALRPLGLGEPRSLGERMVGLCTPGASVSLIEDFEVAWAAGFGTLASHGDREVTCSTIFQAGSISKLVFALGVMRLAQDGIVDLDQDIRVLLTSWAMPAAEAWGARLTLRQLLTHTAGTTVHGFPGYPVDKTRPTIIEILEGRPPANTEPVVVNRLPGLQYQYSGGGTTIAQQAIVDRLGQPFPKLMDDLVLAPLGMARSTFEQPLPTSLRDDAATGHPWSGVAVRGNWHVYPEMAAAGLWTTAGDLARLAVDFLRALRGRPSALGLRKETAAAMLERRWPGAFTDQQFVGLAWFCGGSGNGFYCGHRGGNEGFVAELILFPERGQGAVVMLNSNQGAPLREELFVSLGREYGWPSRSLPISKVAVPLDGLTGAYRHLAGMELRVVEVNGVLQLLFERQPPLTLQPSTPSEFFSSEIQLKICFDRTPEGGVRVTLLQGGGTATTGSPPLEFHRIGDRSH